MGIIAGTLRTIALIGTIGIFTFMSVKEVEQYEAADKAAKAATVLPGNWEEPEDQEEWVSLGEFSATAYCACETCCGYWATIRPTDEHGNPIVYTASGAIAEAGITIAVDPDVIPYGTKVKFNDHIYIAQDTGGAIKGNRVDIYFDSHEEALKFGVPKAEVFICTE